MGIGRISALVFQMAILNSQKRQTVCRLQNRRLRQLLQLAIIQSPFYRKLYRNIDVVNCPLGDLPPVSKELMMNNFDDVVTDRNLRREEIMAWLAEFSNFGSIYKQKYIPFQPSGSTSKDALVVYDRRAMDFVHSAIICRNGLRRELNLADALKYYLKFFFFKKHKMASIVMTGAPFPSYAAALYTPKAHQLLVDHKLLSLLDPLDQLVDKLNTFQPSVLFSYPSILEQLAREQLAGRLTLKFDSPLAYIATGAEPLSATTRRLAYKAWQLEIQDTYGAAESLVIARACREHKQMHLLEDLCIVEIVDRHNRPVAAGEMGEKVLLTNLYNQVQPFIRYELSDVTGILEKACACGQHSPQLLPVVGRNSDTFYFKKSETSGYHTLYPHVFLAPITELDVALGYQFIQSHKDQITLRYIPGSQPIQEFESKLTKTMRKALDDIELKNVKLVLTAVDHIKRHERSGKYQQVVNLVGTPDDLYKP